MKKYIYRSGYLSMRQDNLRTFVGDLLRLLKDNPTYSAVQPVLLELEARYLKYIDLLEKSRDGSTRDTGLKDLAKVALYEHLDLLAYEIERSSGGSEEYIIAAGFPMRSSLRQSYSGGVEAVSNLQAMATGQPGEVRCTFTHPAPRTVRLYTAEYSLTRGDSWQTATFHDQRVFLLTGLPNSREVMVRVRAYGRKGQVSGWSQVVVVAVP